MKFTQRAIIFLLTLSFGLSACSKKKDDDPGQIINDVTRTCTFNAGISGAVTDSISISYIPGTAALEGLTSTYRTADDELSMLSLKPYLNGAASINLYAKPGTMAVGTYLLESFSHGTSIYYNNVIGAQNFEVFSGTLEITSIENVPATSPFVGQKYFSGNFNMEMADPNSDTISVSGVFKDALLITVN